jgi:hypothetical protein
MVSGPWILLFLVRAGFRGDEETEESENGAGEEHGGKCRQG